MSKRTIIGWLGSVVRVIFFGVAGALFIVLLVFSLRLKFSKLETSAPDQELRGRLFNPVKTEFSIPPKAKLISDPQLSADGTRALLLLRKGNGQEVLRLWVQGMGATNISPRKVKSISSPVLSPDGHKIAFFGNNLEHTNLGYLYLWEEGLKSIRVKTEAFVGNWKLAFAPLGTRMLLAPESSESIYLGSFNGEKYKHGELLFVELEKPESQHLVTKSAKPEMVKAKIVRLNDFSTSGTMAFDGFTVSRASEPKDETAKQVGKTVVTRARIVPTLDDLDVDGDGINDLLTFRVDSSPPIWRSYSMSGIETAAATESTTIGKFASWRVGDESGVPVPGDYDGDGVLDLATFTPGHLTEQIKSRGNWKIYFGAGVVFSSQTYQPKRYLELNWGSGKARAVPADYDGDGAMDAAVFQPESATWYLMYSSGKFKAARAMQRQKDYGDVVKWGLAGDIPVPADFDGDAKTDLAVWRVTETVEGSQANWLIRTSDSNNSKQTYTLGKKGDIPFAADFDADGRSDPIVFRPSSGKWLVIRSSKPGEIFEVSWSVAGGEAFIGDFDGDHRVDLGFFSKQGVIRRQIAYNRFFLENGRIPDKHQPFVSRIFWGAIEDKPVRIMLRKHQAEFARHSSYLEEG